MSTLSFARCFHIQYSLKVKVAQSCPTLCDPMDCSPWNSPGQNTGVGSLSLLQGIFPTQGLNPGLPHYRWILYQLSPKRSPLLAKCRVNRELNLDQYKLPLWKLPDQPVLPHNLKVSFIKKKQQQKNPPILFPISDQRISVDKHSQNECVGAFSRTPSSAVSMGSCHPLGALGKSYFSSGWSQQKLSCDFTVVL